MPKMEKIARIHAAKIDLADVLDEFLLFKQAQGTAPRTIKDYRFHVTAFLNTVQDSEPIEKAAIRYFRQPCSPGYRNIKLRYLKSFFNYCVAQGHLITNPVKDIKPAKEDLGNIRHVSMEALKKLMNAPDKKTFVGMRDYCLLLVQVDTGARPGELLRVAVKDLNVETRELRINQQAAKTRIGRTLVLSPLTAQALLKFLKMRPQWWGEDVPLFASENGRPLSGSYWDERLREYCRKAGVKVTPYGLRHSFAIEFLKASNDPFALQRLLGHSDLSMTRRYIRYTKEDIRAIHDKASPLQRLQQLGRRAKRKLN